MLPVANLQLRDLATATVEFFGTLRSPSSTRSTVGSPTEENKSVFSSPGYSPTRELFSPSLRHRSNVNIADRLQSVCSCNSPPPACNTPPTPMRREFDETKRELARTKLEVAKLQDRCKLLEKTLAETKELVRLREEELEKVRNRPEDARRSCNGSVGGGSLLERRFSDDETDHGSFPEESRARMRTTEVYMTRTDSWSGAQVLQAIHDLNSEILQFSAAATELCTFGKNDAAPTKAVAQATQDTVARLGPSLVKILSGRDHSQDPILVQLALQGCISICVARALSVFCMGYPTKADNVLTQIYSHIQNHNQHHLSGEPCLIATSIPYIRISTTIPRMNWQRQCIDGRRTFLSLQEDKTTRVR